MVSGSLTISTPNTVIDGKDVRGCIDVRAPGVIIRRSRVSCTSFYAIGSFDGSYGGTGLLVEDSEVDCLNTSGTAVGDTNFTTRRLNIHGCENGYDINVNVTIEDNYIHDLYDTSESHTDGMQIAVGDNVTIRHNTIYANSGTSAIISPPAGTVNVLITSNLFAGGAFTLYCRQNGSGTNFRVIDNHFSAVFYPESGAYGPWTDCRDEAQVTGNVYHESRQLLPV